MKQWMRHEVSVPRWLCIVYILASIIGTYLAIYTIAVRVMIT